MAVRIFEYDPDTDTKREVEGPYSSHLMPRIDFPDHVITVVSVDTTNGDTLISMTHKDKA